MMTHLGKSAFLISKPLQLMIALCIVQQHQWDIKPVFVILDAFRGAESVAGRLSRDFSHIQTPIFIKERVEAFSFLRKKKFNNLFVDSDVGLQNYIALALQKLSNHRLSIYVYEEGLGTYRTDLYSGFKKKLFSLMGVGVFFGACRFVSAIYVFNPEEYSARISSNGSKAIKIEQKLSIFIKSNYDALIQLFDFHGLPSKLKDYSFCSIYLTSWLVDKDFVVFFKSLKGDLFIKPHPHIKSELKYKGVDLIKSNVPAELIIQYLINIYSFVFVYDHNSSVRRYLSEDNLFFYPAHAYASVDHPLCHSRCPVKLT